MIEFEIRLLEIDKENFINKLNSFGATLIQNELLQKRFVYDFNPINPNKWIRLRTNGEKTTLTIKEILDNSKIAGASELEINVSDFDITNQILNQLGYFHRNYEENKRAIYMLDEVEISIDTWPLIPTYVEFESNNEENILNLIKKLDIPSPKLTTLDVNSIYKQIYNIDMLKIKNLTFDYKQKD